MSITNQKRKWKASRPVLKKATFEFDNGMVRFHYVDGNLVGDVYDKNLIPIGRYSNTYESAAAYAITKTTAIRWLRDALDKQKDGK